MAKRTPFRCVEQGSWRKLDMYSIVGADRTSTAVGVTGVSQCVGIYIQVDETYCFCTHVNMAPMRLAEEPDNPEHEDYKKIKERTVEFCVDAIGPFNPAYLDTLLIVNSYPLFGSGAMIDGVLEWARIEDKKEWRRQNVDSANGFVVPAPGNRRVTPVKLYITRDDEADWEPFPIYGRAAMEPISPVQRRGRNEERK